MNGNETITIEHGHSSDGGFDFAKLTSSELTQRELFDLGNETLRYHGLLQRISGYEIVHPRAIARLGETFTVNQLWDYSAELDKLIQEREELKRKGMVKCDCGHTVHKSQRMMTSNGSSCPDCYDRMSN